jgi:hypothetical protein
MKRIGLAMVFVCLFVWICSSVFIAPNGSDVKAANWTANWIWQSVDGPYNTWISFRKTVTLSAKPTTAITQIAAENMYWLYVNGQLVVKEGGLNCRPDLTNTYYDEIDIANYLQSGSNTIAVLAWYKGGNNGYTQRMVAKGGLLFESTLTGATPAKIISDNTWKMKINPAFIRGSFLYLYNRTGSITYNNTTFGGDPCPNVVKSGYYKTAGSQSPYILCASEGQTYTLSGTCDVAYGAENNQLKPAGDWKWVAWPIGYDARNEMVNWYQSSFDDSAWTAATTKGVPPVAPWNDLKPRTIPMWKDYGLTVYQNQASLPTSVTTNTTITGIVGNNLQGSQYLKVNAPAGVKIKMYMNSYYFVEYYTKAGIQEFDSMVWTNASNSTDEGANTHWAKYEFSNVTGTVQILDLKFHQTSYDTNIVGTFTSSDSNLNTLWTKCKNTSFVCMRDTFFDCPNRERGQWWGDVSEQILYSFYLYDSNSNLLAKKGFREFMNCQKADGSLYTTAPGNVFCLPDQNMTAVISLWDYYLYTGDGALLTELYPNVKKYITYLASIRNADGMILQQTSNGWLMWNWIDWGGNMDLQDGSANTVVNAMFIKLLDAVKNMANVTGNTGDLSYYQGLQDPVKNQFNNYFWKSASSAYVFHKKGSTQSTCIDDRSGAWAALAGMVDSTRRTGVLNTIAARNDCSPYQERYVEDALFGLGADQQALTRMRSRFASMISSGAATLWEEFPASNSNNHAWSAGPLYLLDAYMLGIKPTGAGYSQFAFLPQLGDVTSVSATVPSVKGNILASITKNSSQYTQNLTAPANTTAVVGIPVNAFSAQGKQIATISVNSTTIWNGSYIGGVSGISFNGTDTNYIKFNANPGTWNFVAAPSSVTSTPTPTSNATPTPTPTPSSNKALNKTVTASSSVENSDWGKVKATDGQRSSVTGSMGWSSNNSLTTNHTEQVTVDMGAASSITKVDLYPRSDSPNTGYGFPVNFTIQVSTDNTNWTTVVTKTGYALPGATVQSFTFTAANARYVKIEGTSLRANPNDGSRYRMQFAEIEIY